MIDSQCGVQLFSLEVEQRLLVSAATAISASATIPATVTASVITARMMMGPRRRISIVMFVIEVRSVVMIMPVKRICWKFRTYHRRRCSRARRMMMLSGLFGMSFAVTFALNPTWLTSNDEPDHRKDKTKYKYGLNKPSHRVIIPLN